MTTSTPTPQTLPSLMRRNAATMAARPAVREKDRGIWRTFTWSQYYEEVRDFALGLAAHGFKRGDKLSVIGDNRPRLYWAQLSAQSLGGVAVPVFQDSIASELAYVLDHAEVSVIVAEDQEQVDKVLSLKDKLPALRLLVYDDPRGMRKYDSPLLKSFEAVQAAGRTFAALHPGYVDAEIDKGRADDIALLAYTSGTTGRPKGVMLSYANLISVGESIVAAGDVRVDDEWLCYLPMAWIGDSLYSTTISLMVGFTCNCPENVETVQRDLRELGPSAFLAPPRIWENMLTAIQIRAADASPLKRRLFEFFRNLAERAELARHDGKPLSLATRLGLALGEIFVYAPVRDQLGLRRTRWAYTGGAPLGADAYRFFRSFGINLKQIYGATEVAGLASLQPDGEADPNTVGRICPGMEVRIADNGEVLIRSPGLFAGYYKQPDATKETRTDDGWYRTGDAGFLDPRGHLVIIDRAKDVGALADGTPFAPQFIENKLKFSPFIREAVAFGDGRPYVAALVAIDLATVGKWAERHGLAYTSFQDLSARSEVRALIGEEIRICNTTLPPSGRIRRFLLVNKEFDADDNEITRTRKIRRRFVAEKYAAAVSALYTEAEDVELTTEITYEDGRTGQLKVRLKIADVPDAPAVPEVAAGAAPAAPVREAVHA
ncbi:MAG TPA: AMP-binding protein [Xanthobacteraceae bacterium]|nr:AMP-binding protein [Xanthobacteraceae bacterium]